MAPAGNRVDDSARLRALARYAVVDTAPEPEFDDLAELARRAAHAPVAGISLVDTTRVTFKSLLNTNVHHVPRSQSFCAHNLGGDVLVVPDASTDNRFKNLPLVAGPPHLRFYAGAPLLTGDGFVLGNLFVAGVTPARPSESTVDTLTLLARQAMVLMELRRTELSYHTIVDGAGDVVFHLDDDGRLVSLTPTWARMTGFGAVRSLGRHLSDYASGHERPRIAKLLQAVRGTGQPARSSSEIVTLDGRELPVDLFLNPLRDATGQQVGLVGTLTDISWRKAREVEDQHAAKLESLGRLSAGLAHEINTPIQFVGDNTRFLAESCETMLSLLRTYRHVLDRSSDEAPWEERQEVLNQAEDEAELAYLVDEVPVAVRQSLEGVERVASIVRAMTAFSYRGQDFAPADLNQALRTTITVANNEIKPVADVELDLADLPPVRCLIGDLNQVFLNLVLNAVHAMEETGRRGTLRLSTRHDGEHVVVEMADTGGGIPEDIQRKVFEPFFTTKPVGRGTGQGLALARALIQERHGGQISLSSAVGEGTTFTLRLPVNGTAQHRSDK
jgi:PAS domain S-box-containing protein